MSATKNSDRFSQKNNPKERISIPKPAKLGSPSAVGFKPKYTKSSPPPPTFVDKAKAVTKQAVTELAAKAVSSFLQAPPGKQKKQILYDLLPGQLQDNFGDDFYKRTYTSFVPALLDPSYKATRYQDVAQPAIDLAGAYYAAPITAGLALSDAAGVGQEVGTGLLGVAGLVSVAKLMSAVKTGNVAKGLDAVMPLAEIVGLASVVPIVREKLDLDVSGLFSPLIYNTLGLGSAANKIKGFFPSLFSDKAADRSKFKTTLVDSGLDDVTDDKYLGYIETGRQDYPEQWENDFYRMSEEERQIFLGDARAPQSDELSEATMQEVLSDYQASAERDRVQMAQMAQMDLDRRGFEPGDREPFFSPPDLDQSNYPSAADLAEREEITRAYNAERERAFGEAVVQDLKITRPELNEETVQIMAGLQNEFFMDMSFQENYDYKRLKDFIRGNEEFRYLDNDNSLYDLATMISNGFKFDFFNDKVYDQKTLPNTPIIYLHAESVPEFLRNFESRKAIFKDQKTLRYPKDTGAEKVFYSKTEKFIRARPEKSATGAKWKEILLGTGVVNKGLNKGELEYHGLLDLKDDAEYTKKEVLAQIEVYKFHTQFYREFDPENLSGNRKYNFPIMEGDDDLSLPIPDQSARMPKIPTQWGLTRDDTYFEVMLGLDDKDIDSPRGQAVYANFVQGLNANGENPEARRSITEKFVNSGYDNWEDGHMEFTNFRNPIGRIGAEGIRFNGKNVLLIHEFQGPTNPSNMPTYLQLQNHGSKILLKYILTFAKQNGYDAVMWANGETQSELRWAGGNLGELYDKMLVGVMNDIVKKTKAKMGKMEHPFAPRWGLHPYLDISTPEMQDLIDQGWSVTKKEEEKDKKAGVM